MPKKNKNYYTFSSLFSITRYRNFFLHKKMGDNFFSTRPIWCCSASFLLCAGIVRTASVWIYTYNVIQNKNDINHCILIIIDESDFKKYRVLLGCEMAPSKVWCNLSYIHGTAGLVHSKFAFKTFWNKVRAIGVCF